MGAKPITCVIPDDRETYHPPAHLGLGKETLSFFLRGCFLSKNSLVFLFGATKMDIQPLLELSSRNHAHLCPRQILGVRIGLAGIQALGFHEPPKKKQLLVISETDGCFVDGVIAATGCTVGHRTLRVEDYGKVAATFVDTVIGRAVRVAPTLDIREKAYAYAPDESRHYFAQMQAYQVMPDELMLTVQSVVLNTPVEQIISRPGVRVNCDLCGEEIMNEREVHQNGHTLCPSCAGGGYYQANQQMVFHLSRSLVERI
jgi:formylmethanofuran dehydrogenase subunit E